MIDIETEKTKALRFQQAGHLDRAEEIYKQILAINPDHSEALNLLGIISHQYGKNEKAIELVNKAIENNPGSPCFYYNLGCMYASDGRHEKAKWAFQEAVALKPDYADAYYNLGLALKDLGKYDAAVENYKQAIRLKPDDAEIRYNLGIVLLISGRIAGAIMSLQQAVLLAPDYFEAYNNLGTAYKELGRIEESLESYTKAIELKPDYADAHWNRSLVNLLSGNFARGWEEYEWRFQKSKGQTTYPHRHEGLRWNGASFAGKTLFVHCEQGLGDTIQFVRYLPMVKARGGTVIFEVMEPLYGVLQGFPGVDKLLQLSYEKKPDIKSDYYVPLMSLPGIFGTNIETIPSDVPYIRADPKKAERWQKQLKGNSLKVGLVWSGKFTDVRRSCPLRFFSPLAGIPGVKLYGLQKGKAAQQVRELSDNIMAASLGEQFDDFTDTAGAVENLDLVISVDTSVAHLAGAMGKPVWLLLPFASDWRWMVEREDSPWYPTMRIFRQQKPFDWENLLKRVAGELDLLTRDQRPAEIIESHSMAIKIKNNPLDSDFHNDMGLVLAGIGKYDQAIRHFSQAVHIKPDYADAYYNLANALKTQGRIEDAIENYRKALRLKPDFADAYYNLGNTLKIKGLVEEAIDNYQHALQLKPDFAKAYNNLGNALKDQGDFDSAIECYMRAIDVSPNFANAYNNFGSALQIQGQLDSAIEKFQIALRLKPDYADACYNLGHVLQCQGRFEAAIEKYHHALKLKPDFARAYNNLGNALHSLGRIEPAIENYQYALQLKPDYADAHWNLSLAHLLSGNFAQGWKGYGWRFKKANWKKTYPGRFKMPVWDGSSFAGKRLYIHDEQGLGDTIQFVRYIPMVKERGGTVIFETRRPLLSLLKNYEGIDHLVERSKDGNPAAECDLYIPLLSLPGIFNTTLETIPSGAPYIQADPKKIERWRNRLAGKGFKVGFVWAGRPTGRDENQGLRNRSCPLERFAPLTKIEGIRLYGLQKGEAAIQTESLPEGMMTANPGEEFEDFADTAGVIENLDLVISIDTSVAHLAGAMGKPVWVLLQRVSDWRWMLDREDCPWYPTMRLFRQKKDNDWDEVICRIECELKKLVQTNKNLREKTLTQKRDEVLYLALPPPKNNFGWGICSKYFIKELQKKTKISALSKSDMEGGKKCLPGKMFHALTGINFSSMFEGIRGKENFGYTFFENELTVESVRNAKKYDLVLGGSTWCRDRMLEKGITNWGVLLQGIDPEYFYPILEEKKQDYFVIFSGGKFELRKGQDLVLKAVKILQDKYSDIILVNCWRNIWPETMHLMSSSPHIKYEYMENTWRGFMNHIYEINGLDSSRIYTVDLVPNETQRELYKNTDIGVFPNRCEGGTNLVLMEYMACAKPVIASNTSGHRDIVTEKNALLLNDLQDIEIRDVSKRLIARWREPSLDELVDRIEYAYHHREEIKKTGCQAGSDLKKFTWEKSASQLLDKINLNKNSQVNEQSIRKRYSLCREKISGIDLWKYSRYVANMEHRKCFFDVNFKEHYRLIACLSTLFDNGNIFDIGTNLGCSALALSYNSTNRVISYDLIECRELYYAEELFNIEFLLGDVLQDRRLIRSNLIMLDTNHDGVFERKLYDFLKRNNYKGLLFLDDIHLNQPMKDFWHSISEPKEDITDLGHWSGSGIVDFA